MTTTEVKWVTQPSLTLLNLRCHRTQAGMRSDSSPLSPIPLPTCASADRVSAPGPKPVRIRQPQDPLPRGGQRNRQNAALKVTQWLWDHSEPDPRDR